jgi:hypothetical protein
MLANLWHDKKVRDYFLYFCLAVLLLLALAVPIWLYPTALDDQHDLRQRLALVEKKLKELEVESGRQRYSLLANQSAEKAMDTLPVKPPAIGHADPLPQLTQLLKLSPPQQQQIARLMAALPDLTDSDHQVWQELDMRERICQLLQATQRRQYLSYLRETGRGF